MKKVNTTINRPEISSHEIKKGKDFDQLYKNYAKATKPFFKQNWFIANTFVVAGAVALIFALYSPEEPINNNEIANIQTTIDNTQYAEKVESAPFINPLIKELNVPFDFYEVNSNKTKTIQHKTGSVIKIPKNAFVDKNGNLVKGKVEIRYREFKDVVEIIASGIPMTFDENGEVKHFESAGMIEILAYQDGKPVFMNPEKKIDIEMTSEYPGAHYNLYNLDTAAKKWVDIGKDKIVYKGGQQNKPVIEETIVEQPFEIEKYPKETTNLKTIKKETVEVQKDIRKIKKTAPKQPQEATNERFRFDIDFKKEEFPELVVYKNMEFEVGKENKDFTPKWFETEWQDMNLEKGNKDNYIIELTRYTNKKNKNKDSDKNEFNKIVKKITVYPVFVGENYTKAIAAFNKKYKTYTKKLSARKADEKRILEKYEKELARIKVQQEKWAKAQEKRREKDNEDVDTWIANSSSSDNAYNTSEKMYRLFAVEKFGIYNCDNPISLPKGQTIMATFYNQDKKIVFNKIFLIEKGKNAVFAYYPGTTNRFKFNPDADNMIIGVSAKNELISYPVEKFKTIPKDKRSYNFQMEVKETNPKNLNELRQCISFL